MALVKYGRFSYTGPHVRIVEKDLVTLGNRDICAESAVLISTPNLCPLPITFFNIGLVYGTASVCCNILVNERWSKKWLGANLDFFRLVN